MPESSPVSNPPSRPNLRDRFVNFSKLTSHVVGSYWAFLFALLIILIWGITGPLFKFSDTWQLIINTGTTIVTFLMVFLIQSTQNRDAEAIHLKLDELIRAMRGARDNLILTESMSEDELKRLADEFKKLHDRACEQALRRKGSAHPS